MKKVIFKLIAKIYFKIRDISYKVKYLKYREKYILADTFKFNGNEILFYGEGNIKIGENTYIGAYSTIQAYTNCKVIIGSNCSISHYVKIYTMNSNPQDIIENKKNISRNIGNVTIGNNCWIGANVFIKEGISIGDNCVIGANSVVVKNIPSGHMYVGNRIL